MAHPGALIDHADQFIGRRLAALGHAQVQGAAQLKQFGADVFTVNLIGRATLRELGVLMTAIMVSLVGSIGFVGLVIPHAMRFAVGPRHGALVPWVALAGAVFLIAADVVSRMLIPGQVAAFVIISIAFWRLSPSAGPPPPSVTIVPFMGCPSLVVRLTLTERPVAGHRISVPGVPAGRQRTSRADAEARLMLADTEWGCGAG